jgi:murein DD-endopeptidase MepM/ murein hydrolase activator NlpD
MPRVPTYDAFTVQSTGLPTPSVPYTKVDATPAVTTEARLTQGDAPNVPDYAGRQAQLSGQALESAGLAADRMLLDMQREANQLRVDDSLNQTKEEMLRLTYDKDVGYLNQKGVDALNRKSGMALADEYAKTLQERVNTISEGLGNDAQKRAYGLRANDMIMQLRGQAMGHESQEFRTYALSVREGTIKTRMNEIGLNYNNPEVVDVAVESIQAASYDMARLLGKAPVWAEAEARRMTSNAHMVAINAAMEKNDVVGADRYFNKYVKQMDADDILRVQGHITKDMDGRVAVGVANNVMNNLNPRMVTQPVDRALNIVRKIKPEVMPGDEPMGVMPVVGANISSNFGPRTDPFSRKQTHHDGIDFAAPMGSTIVASAAGTVKSVGNDPKGYGNYIEIEHADGVVTRYSHASRITAEVNQQVNAGDPIGAVGSTGKSTGPHLHFEVLRGGKPVDPAPFLKQGGRAKEGFSDYMKEYRGDIAKSFAAMLFDKKYVDDVIDRAAVEGVNWMTLTKKNEQEQISQAVKEYGAGQGAYDRPTLADVHNLVRQQLGPQTSPQRMKLALDESTRQFNEQTAAIKQRDEEVVAEVQRTLIANGGNFSAIPFNLRSQIPPDKYDNIQDFAGKVGKGVPIQTDWSLYYQFKTNPQLLKSANLMAFRDKLGDTEFKNLTEEQQNVRQGKEDLFTRVRTIKDVLNNHMREVGVDPTPKDNDKKAAEKVGKIWSAFEDIVREREVSLGRKMTYEEMQKAAASMFTKVETYGNLWNSETPKVLVGPSDKVVVPKADRALIIEALKQAQKPVSEDIIEAMYRYKNGIVPKKAK